MMCHQGCQYNWRFISLLPTWSKRTAIRSLKGKAHQAKSVWFHNAEMSCSSEVHIVQQCATKKELWREEAINFRNRAGCQFVSGLQRPRSTSPRLEPLDPGCNRPYTENHHHQTKWASFSAAFSLSCSPMQLRSTNNADVSDCQRFNWMLVAGGEHVVQELHHTHGTVSRRAVPIWQTVFSTSSWIPSTVPVTTLSFNIESLHHVIPWCVKVVVIEINCKHALAQTWQTDWQHSEKMCSYQGYSSGPTGMSGRGRDLPPKKKSGCCSGRWFSKSVKTFPLTWIVRGIEKWRCAVRRMSREVWERCEQWRLRVTTHVWREMFFKTHTC